MPSAPLCAGRRRFMRLCEERNRYSRGAGMDLQLPGKVAVVPGGSAGIGLAVARGLAAEGTHVALCARDEARLRSAAAEIEGVRVLTVPADLAVPGESE